MTPHAGYQHMGQKSVPGPTACTCLFRRYEAGFGYLNGENCVEAKISAGLPEEATALRQGEFCAGFMNDSEDSEIQLFSDLEVFIEADRVDVAMHLDIE